MAKIKTINQLITVFKDAANRHYQINGFGYGDNWEVGASEAKMHPVLWINPVSALMTESDNNIGYKTFEIDFEIRIFDLVNKDESNEKEVLSDGIDILKDIITEFKSHPYYTNSKLNIINDIDFEPFTEEFDEEVTGWVCELSFKTPLINSWCGLPMAEIEGFSFPGGECDGYNAICDATYVEDVIGVYPIEVATASGNTKIISIDTSSLTGDTFVTGGTFNNTTNNLELTRNDGVIVLTDLTALKDDTNSYTTGATFDGSVISFDRTDLSDAYSVDISSVLTGISFDNIYTADGTLTSDRTMFGDNKVLNLGDASSRLSSFNINSVTSNQTFTTAGFGSINSSYNPNSVITTATDVTGNFTNTFTINSNQTKSEATDISGNKTSFIDVINSQAVISSTDTSTGQNSISTIADNQASLYHTDGGSTNNQVILTDNNIIISHTDGTTTNGITIDNTKLLLYGPTTDLNFTSTDTTFTDTRAITKGIEYAADYSAGWTDNSLITKKFVEDSITAISFDNIYTADGTLTGDRTIDTDGNILTIDGSATASNDKIFVINKPAGEAFSVDEDGDVLVNGSIKNSTFFGVEANQTGYWYHGTIRNIQIGKTSTTTRTKFDQNGVNFINNLDTEIHRIGLAGGSTGEYTTFFKTGFASNRNFVVGGVAPLACEDISLQGKTLINDELVLKASITAVSDACHIDNSYSFYIDSGALKGRYKDNLGVVTDLTIGSTEFGIIEVILDSDAGEPTYFTDLQTALETCKTSGSNNVVKLHSDIDLTAAIEINQAGTGVGNGYNFDTLTIDFNGFTISNNQSDSTKVFNFNDGSTAVVQTVRFINGRILRTNATSGEAIYMKQFDVLMSDMVIDSNVTTFTTAYSGINKLLFGGSRFIGRGTLPTLNTNGYFTVENFYVENTSTGTAYISGYGCKNFTAKAGSGSCLSMPNAAGFATDFTLISGTGIALQPSVTGDKTITNFTIESESGSAIRIRNYGATRHVFSNFNIVCENGVVFDTVGVEFSSFDVLNIAGSLDMGFFENCKVTNGKLESRKTSGNIMSIRADNRFENVSFIATDAEGPNLFDLSSRNDSVFKNCNFTCLLDTTAGHAVDITGIDGGNADFMNCTFEVVNAGANCITSADAESVTVSNCTFKGATTPINANVTLSNPFTSDPYGNITI